MPKPPIVIEVDQAWVDYWRSLADHDDYPCCKHCEHLAGYIHPDKCEECHA